MEEASYGWTDEGKKGFFLSFFFPFFSIFSFSFPFSLFGFCLLSPLCFFFFFFFIFHKLTSFFFFYLVQNVAFVLDPDGYWIEVIQNEKYKAAPGKY